MSAPAPGSSISVDHSFTPPVVAVTGELDLSTVPQLAEGIDQLSDDGHAVTLDLAALSSIDSSGLKAFTDHGQRGVTLDCSGAQPLALKLLDVVSAWKAAEPATDQPPVPQVCMRCRKVFPGDPTLLPTAMIEWWACGPCRLVLLGPPGATTAPSAPVIPDDR